MEIVEVVIRLPKDVYEEIESSDWGNLAIEGFCEAVIKGTPLPKGHGRLIDADAVLEDPYGDTRKDIEIAETIIKADKEVKECKKY